MGQVLSWLQSLFWSQEMEIAILGLQNAGKSSFVNVLNTGQFEESMIPTVGFNMHKVQKGKVTIKVWDMGGQKKFRSMWERYCRGVNVICFVVDAADQKSLSQSQKELQSLLEKPTLAGVPLLVLFNKNDLATAEKPENLVKVLELDAIKGRDIAYFPISCKTIQNIDKAMDWIIKFADKQKKAAAASAPAASAGSSQSFAPAATSSSAAPAASSAPAAASATAGSEGDSKRVAASS